jgi:hypothetical protein
LSRRSYIYWYPLLLVLAWIVAWLVNLDLRSAWHWGVTADTVYWIAMKFIVWLMPVGVLIVVVEKKPRGFSDASPLLERHRGACWLVL